MPNHLIALLAASTLIQAQLPSTADAQSSGKQANLYAKPSVVRILAGCSGTYSYSGNEYALTVGEVGAGYFVDASGDIVTNAHVLQPGEASGCRDLLFKRFVELVTNEKDAAQVSDREKADIRRDSQLISKIDYVNQIVLPSGDALPFEIKQTASESGINEDIAIVKVNVSNAPTLKIPNLSITGSQTAATALGYPLNQNFTAIATQAPVNKLPIGEPLGQIVTFNGRIAPANQNSGGGRPMFYFDARLPEGISGSPVFNGDGQMVGMMTSHGGANQPLNAATIIPSSTILKLVQQMGIRNQEGTTDQLYRDGLALLQQKKFAAAKVKFQKLRELFPYHSEADWLIHESDQGMAQAQQQQQRMLFIFAGGAVIGAFALYRLLWSQKVRAIAQYWFGRSPEPAMPAGAPPAPIEPDGVIESAAPRPKQAAVTQISRNGGSSSTVISAQQFIELKNQDGQVRRFYLRRDRHQIGRDRDWADLHTPDVGWEVLSRHHAILEKEGADYRIFDGDRQTPSTNGILVNGNPITTHEGYLLQDGDRLETGDDPRNQVIWTYSNPGKRQATQFSSPTTVNDAKL